MKSIVPVVAALALAFSPIGNAGAAAKDPHVRTAPTKAGGKAKTGSKTTARNGKAKPGKRLAIKSTRVIKAAPLAAAATIDYDGEHSNFLEWHAVREFIDEVAAQHGFDRLFHFRLQKKHQMDCPHHRQKHRQNFGKYLPLR